MATSLEEEKEIKFKKSLVTEYLKCGSVDEAMRTNDYSLPISYAQYQRVLDEWGIIKAAGPNNKLTEAIDVMIHLAEQKLPLEKLYKRIPSSFQSSVATAYRILSYIKEGVTRRIGTGLVITPKNNSKILVGDDLDAPKLDLGKPYGSISIPMGFSRKRDSRYEAVLRLLQQEVYTNKAIEKKLPKSIIPTNPKPFMFLDIADIRVEVIHLSLSKKFTTKVSFSSFKLDNHRFMKTSTLMKDNKNMRAGMKEIAQGFDKYCQLKKRNLVFNPLQYRSGLNYFLAGIPNEIDSRL